MAKESCRSEALENLSFCFLVRHEQADEESNLSLKEKQIGEERDRDDVVERISRSTYTPLPGRGEQGREHGRGRTLFKSSRKKRFQRKHSLSSLNGDPQVKDGEEKERTQGEEEQEAEKETREEGKEERLQMSSLQEAEESQERNPSNQQETQTTEKSCSLQEYTGSISQITGGCNRSEEDLLHEEPLHNKNERRKDQASRTGASFLDVAGGGESNLEESNSKRMLHSSDPTSSSCSSFCKAFNSMGSLKRTPEEIHFSSSKKGRHRQQQGEKMVRRPRYSLVYLHPHPKGLLASLPLPKDLSSGRWRASEVLRALWNDQSDSTVGEMTKQMQEELERGEEEEEKTRDRKRNEGEPQQGSDDKEEGKSLLCRREELDRRREEERGKEAFHEEKNGYVHRSTDVYENNPEERIHRGATETQRHEEKEEKSHKEADLNGKFTVDEEETTLPNSSNTSLSLDSKSSSSSLLSRSSSSSSSPLSCASGPLKEVNDKKRDEALRQRLASVGALSLEVARRLEGISPHHWRGFIEDMLAGYIEKRYVCPLREFSQARQGGGGGEGVEETSSSLLEQYIFKQLNGLVVVGLSRKFLACKDNGAGDQDCCGASKLSSSSPSLSLANSSFSSSCCPSASSLSLQVTTTSSSPPHTSSTTTTTSISTSVEGPGGVPISSCKTPPSFQSSLSHSHLATSPSSSSLPFLSCEKGSPDLDVEPACKATTHRRKISLDVRQCVMSNAVSGKRKRGAFFLQPHTIVAILSFEERRRRRNDSAPEHEAVASSPGEALECPIGNGIHTANYTCDSEGCEKGAPGKKPEERQHEEQTNKLRKERSEQEEEERQEDESIQTSTGGVHDRREGEDCKGCKESVLTTGEDSCVSITEKEEEQPCGERDKKASGERGSVGQDVMNGESKEDRSHQSSQRGRRGKKRKRKNVFKACEQAKQNPMAEEDKEVIEGDRALRSPDGMRNLSEQNAEEDESNDRWEWIPRRIPIYACVKGILLEFNSALVNNPELLLSEPEHSGWVLIARPSKGDDGRRS
ncbi:hypothetical protein CSUI_003464 [Cystoisospora suis]|uniref:Uncharacterized protein n=1 Tax=Cystoisospora suis TaxID=483139 RepID=A0A2C6L5A7_9APIC|nr:hypothetical protein CSUI_003464 [Cystoisospora suis]